ncbi:unnamed protein product [Auanema sp. JU1783]|nr:unnamed protein product [Auanema sp. JU1783]
MYLLKTVPTKLNLFTQFAIHGHDLISAIAQIYLTLGTTPFLGVSNIVQLWTQIILISLSGSFSLLLVINRTLAISSEMRKWKKVILSVFFSQAVGQVVFLAAAGLTIKDLNEEGRRQCLKIISSEYYQI